MNKKQPIKDIKLVVISHFYNEEFLLPYWLRYHTKLFDYGVLIDYDSTDDSISIIKNLAPHWEIRRSRNRVWDFIEADKEIMEIEKEFDCWKIVLNTTEFIIHENLKEYLNDFQSNHSELLGVRTNGIIMVDSLEDKNKTLNSEQHLIFQRHYGYLESDYAPITQVNPLHRSRFLHQANCGRYTLGRHNTEHYSIIDQNLFLLWFGFSPFQYIKSRKLSFKNRMSERNISMQAGMQHMWNESEIEENFIRESRRSYNLVEELPNYKKILDKINSKYPDL